MLEELKKQIDKLEQENYEKSIFHKYDDGFVDGMQLVYDYLIGVKSLPNYKPSEIIEKLMDSDNEITVSINNAKLKGVK